jgi:HEAT repeat protein
MLQRIKVARCIRRLQHKNPKVVSEAAKKLGEIGHTSAVEPLTRLLQHHHPWVRDAAASALVVCQGSYS